MLDETAIRAFVREDYPRLVNAVALVTASYPAAEDMVQEALARAWSRIDRGESIDSLPNWVAAVALNLSRSRWRRLVVERRAGERLVHAETMPAPSDDHIDIARALAELPRRQREVAVLRYLIGMSTREVAGTLGVGEGTVKNSLAKARTALAERLRVVDMEVPNDVTDR